MKRKPIGVGWYDDSYLESYILKHPRGREFVEWMEVHPSALVWLALVVLERVKRGQYPVGPDYLIEMMRHNYDCTGSREPIEPKINPRWAPLLARALMLEYPELNAAIRIAGHR